MWRRNFSSGVNEPTGQPRPVCHNRANGIWCTCSQGLVALCCRDRDGACADPAVAPTRLQGAVRPPKLHYQISKLPNGLTVILSEDHSTPIVHVQMWYHVGSKDERRGRTGFAHLFEHMMFKGSKNVEPEAHTSYMASVGGQSNAYTNEDKTVFWQTAPAQYLPLILWLEADRMATLRINKDTFERERLVVKEERRMRVENQPYGRLPEIIFDNAFTVHPYKHPADRIDGGPRGGLDRRCA